MPANVKAFQVRKVGRPRKKASPKKKMVEVTDDEDTPSSSGEESEATKNAVAFSRLGVIEKQMLEITKAIKHLQPNVSHGMPPYEHYEPTGMRIQGHPVIGAQHVLPSAAAFGPYSTAQTAGDIASHSMEMGKGDYVPRVSKYDPYVASLGQPRAATGGDSEVILPPIDDPEIIFFPHDWERLAPDEFSRHVLMATIRDALNLSRAKHHWELKTLTDIMSYLLKGNVTEALVLASDRCISLRHMETNVHKGASYFASCRSAKRPAKHREAEIKSEFTTKKNKRGQVQEENHEAKALWKDA